MAAYFDGSTSYSYKTGLLPSTAVPLTFSCWVNPNSRTAAANRGLVRLGLSSATAANRDCVRLALTINGYLSAQAASSSGINASISTNPVNAGQWNHCLGVFTSNSSRTAYLNATAATTNTVSRVITIGATQLGIGASVYNSLGTINDYFAGAIAHVAIWDEALSTGEIIALASGNADPKTIRPSALRYYNPLVTPVSAPSEAIVNHAWSSFNQAKYPYTNGDPGAQVFVNIARTADNPYIAERRPVAKIYLFAPQGGTNVTVDVTGVEATGAVGTVTTVQNVDYTVTGQSATGAIGTTTQSSSPTQSVTGQSATGALPRCF